MMAFPLRQLAATLLLMAGAALSIGWLLALALWLVGFLPVLLPPMLLAFIGSFALLAAGAVLWPWNTHEEEDDWQRLFSDAPPRDPNDWGGR